ncbi:MAG: LysR family transcriptional regulator [Deltaproteobacteria bacterium]|nr:LysR family transcriptional regulator [Deltaproteobacteria bacterium]
MEIRQLRTFKSVATLLSFHKTAKKLNYAQSSISAQIQALEAELGVQLFDRLGKRILLTEAGERLLQYSHKVLDLTDEIRTELTQTKEPKGSLTIRIPESLGVHRLPPVIREFHRRYPQVLLNFTVCAHEELQKDLRKGITDLAFLYIDSIQASDLGFEVLGFESLVLVASPEHPLVSQKTVFTKDLGGETLLLSRVDCSYRRLWERILAEKGVQAKNTLIFHSVETLKRCAREGIGITLLPETAVKEEIANKSLVVLPWEEGKPETAIMMIWYQERWLSPSLKAFMKITREILNVSI